MNIKRWLTGIGVIAFLSVSLYGIADQADSLDLHSNVKEAVGIADVSSAVCVEVDSDGNMQVDVNAIVPGTGATDLGKSENNIFVTGDVGVASMTLRSDTAAATAGTDLYYQPLITDANGRLHVIDVLNASDAGANSATVQRVTIATDDEINDDLDAIKTAVEVVDGAFGAGNRSGNQTSESVVIAGMDGSVIRNVATDAAGMVYTIDISAFHATANDGAAIGAAGIQVSGTDGTNNQIISVNSSGQQVMVGAGTAGSANAAVVTVQGVGSMTPILTSGTGTAGSAAAAVTTIQGVGSMTPVIVSNATASSLLTENSPAAKTGTVAVADGQIKATPGTVYAVLVSGAGVTAADKVEITNSPSAAIGTALFTVVADAANGTWAFYPCVGVSFDSGIYYDETKSGGTFTTTVVYE